MSTKEREKIKARLCSARAKMVIAQNAENKVYEMIEGATGLHLDEISSRAENANNLEEAISCFIDYGEFDVDGILDEIETAQTNRYGVNV